MKLPVFLCVLVCLVSAALGQPPGTNDLQQAAEFSLFVRFYRVEIDFSDLRPLMVAKETQTDGQVLLSYFKQKGVDLSLPSALFYTVGEKSLVVRSTIENLDKLDALFKKPKRRK